MIGGLGVGELSIILGIVVVLFGAGRLAGIGSGLGKGIRNFRKEVAPDPKIEIEDKPTRAEDEVGDVGTQTS